MNWDQISGKWWQLKGEIRQRWGQLTDDDLQIIAGNKDRFIGRIQERYGILKGEAEQQINDWSKAIRRAGSNARRPVVQIAHGQIRLR